MFTIVFLSFHSEKHIKRLVSGIANKYPIIVIENSLNHNFKNELEEKHDNVKVIVPNMNLGIPKGYNLGIKESKTNYVKLTSADVEISNKSLEELEECIKSIKDFAILGPTYHDESIYKNYKIWDSANKNKYKKDEIFTKYNIKEVDFLENDFIVSKKEFNDIGFFDEKMFLYYETMDLSQKVRNANKKIYICDKIKFKHYGSQSVSSEFSYLYSLSRSWHYNWSKFYYFKKNFGYFFALKKIFPNFIRALKKMIISLIFVKKKDFKLYKAELLGILTSVLNKSSDFRPFE